jgi:hypothetical protein
MNWRERLAEKTLIRPSRVQPKLTKPSEMALPVADKTDETGIVSFVSAQGGCVQRPNRAPRQVSSVSPIAPRTLEARVRAMAMRWGFSPDEIIEELGRAATHPASELLWVEHDERKFGNGDVLYVWH